MSQRPIITLKPKPQSAVKKAAVRKTAAQKTLAHQASAPKTAAEQQSGKKTVRLAHGHASKPGSMSASKPVTRPASQPVSEPVRQELKADSLALAFLGAAEAVAQVKAGTALPQALARVFVQQQPLPQMRGAMQDIAYRTMRQLGLVETLIGLMTSKAPEPALLHGLLCCALTLLAEPASAADAKSYEAFTVVDQAVTAAAADSSIVHGKGMMNAVLRRFLREREVLMQQARQKPVAVWNYPQWWLDATKAAYPRDWQAILTAGNQPPPLTLRVNLKQTTVAACLRQLADGGMAATQIGAAAVRLEKPVPVEQIPGFADGLVSVQDAAAQLAAPLLDVHDGMRVLDACAAPGGKTGHLLEMAAIDLLALDADQNRLARIGENLQRLHLPAQVQVGDAASTEWWDGHPFDRILADVPCTASGIVRRHPDIRWLRRKGDARQLATFSAQILDNLWQMLRPGGKFLFVTCSLWPQESEQQAAAFAVRNHAIRLEAPGQILPAANAEQDHDGLFYALFQKNQE
ncbi:MAG: putative rRNA methyltransferase [Burkholderiaceae bacterium]|nr:putative rRNA methyltransferase [Burkholderiaceae bacterium]